MSRGDAESRAQLQWIQQVGCNVQLQPLEVRQMLTPRTRSIWHHLQLTVKPVELVQIIQENVLLEKVQKEANCDVEAMAEVELLKRISVVQHKINSTINDKKFTHNAVQYLMGKVGHKKHSKIKMINEVEEKETQCILLSFKSQHIKRLIKKLDKDILQVHMMEKISKPVGYDTKGPGFSNIITDLIKNSSTSTPCLCEEDQEILLNLSQCCSSRQLNKVFLGSVVYLIKSLKKLLTKLVSMKNDGLNANHCTAHLKHLKVRLIENELELSNYKNQLKLSSPEFEQEKLGLVKLICNLQMQNSIYSNGDYEIVLEKSKEFVNKIVNIKNSRKITDLIECLETKCYEYDSLLETVRNKVEKENNINKEINLIVSHVNKLLQEIFYGEGILHKRTSIYKMCREYVFTFLTEENSVQNVEELCSVLGNITQQEIKTFTKASLAALTRSWDTGSQLVPTELSDKLSANTDLCVLLLNAKPSNILKNFLENIFWAKCYKLNNIYIHLEDST